MSKPVPQSPVGPATPRPDEPDPDEPDPVDNREPEPIDPAHRAAVEAGLADMRAGRIATKAETEAAYARFGRVTR